MSSGDKLPARIAGSVERVVGRQPIDDGGTCRIEPGFTNAGGEGGVEVFALLSIQRGRPRWTREPFPVARSTATRSTATRSTATRSTATRCTVSVWSRRPARPSGSAARPFSVRDAAGGTVRPGPRGAVGR